MFQDYSAIFCRHKKYLNHCFIKGTFGIRRASAPLSISPRAFFYELRASLWVLRVMHCEASTLSRETEFLDLPSAASLTIPSLDSRPCFTSPEPLSMPCGLGSNDFGTKRGVSSSVCCHIGLCAHARVHVRAYVRACGKAHATSPGAPFYCSGASFGCLWPILLLWPCQRSF